MSRFFALLATVAVFGLAACGDDNAAEQVQNETVVEIEQTSEEYLDAVSDAIDDAEADADAAFEEAEEAYDEAVEEAEEEIIE